jgi:hypothetical protein
LKKQQAYNRIAKATIKALKEQAEMGKVNELTTEAVYLAIDKAFNKEYRTMFERLEQVTTALEFVAKGKELEKEQLIALAQQSLTQK